MCNNHYPIKLGINKNVPFRSYNESNEIQCNFHNVNVVAINSPSERATCIVVEEDGKYADFYYNGSESKFKQLSEVGHEIYYNDIDGNKLDKPIGSWEEEDFGITPKCILENGVSQELINKLTN